MHKFSNAMACKSIGWQQSYSEKKEGIFQYSQERNIEP